MYKFPGSSACLTAGRQAGVAVDPEMTKWYVYALESLKDHNLYIGISRDPQKRLGEHNKGKTRSTRSRRPFRIIYQEECASLEEAREKEKYYKTTTGRRALKRLKNKHFVPR